MPDKMLIDATHPEETRVVVLRGNRVEEFDFESANRKQLRGNIYLAKVTRVEPSLQAAFVDYGGNRHGFLAFSEIHPDYYQIPVADRQALIAQEERDAKAADVEADMVFRYTFRAPGIARRGGAGLRFDGIFRADAGRAYAELPTRERPQWNADPVNATLALRVRLPAGATLGALPPDAHGEDGARVRWSVELRPAEGGFTLARRVQVPTGRVAAGVYPGFAEAIRALDTADTREVEITLPAR